jgi:ComF family protein
MPYFNKLKDILLDILFPPICLNCEKTLLKEERDNAFCALCFSKIIVHTSLFCPICRARLPENKKICHKSAKFLLAAATNFDEPIKNLIHQFKYGYWTRLIKPIGNILAAYLENLTRFHLVRFTRWNLVKVNIGTSEIQNINDNSGTSDVQTLKKKIFQNYIVIPIPLHKNRQRERGFNQAELLGKIISEKLNLVMRRDLLVRVKETKNQAELKNWKDRKKNLEKSFAVTAPEIIRKKNIILVDDVCTSGATIEEAAKTLKESGTRKIIALVVAKAR